MPRESFVEWRQRFGRARVEYTRVTELHGPIMVVPRVRGVGVDEFARIRLASGERRHGLVLEVDRDRAVVQVLEGTEGMRPDGVRVAFSGKPLHIPVGAGWLGRVCDGLGVPLDGGPPILAAPTVPVSGFPMNPTHREPPAEAVLTGISAVDALTTLARGQKLPIFSIAGLPHLELATQIAAQASAGDEPFCVVFAAMGLTHADVMSVRDTLEERSAAGELVLLLNLADAPVIERILTPRIALTVAEHLAFTEGRHVLVVMGDMTSYSEALREVSAARGEVPARRAYPGYLYSDLASLYERCGRIRGRPGSVTILPVLTMPAGDITHPVPDLTGYITEGQIVLSQAAHARGVHPPVDALSSLSRLMRKAAGPQRTREDHLDVAAQILAALAQARRVRELGELVGVAALSDTDHRYLDFDQALHRLLITQDKTQSRTLDDALTRAWQALSVLPRHELAMVAPQTLNAHYHGTMIFGMPPGRMGRLWLRHRLSVAERAAELLGRRLQLLTTAQDRLRLLVRETSADWAARSAEADQWLLRAALLGGRRALRLAADDTLAHATIEYTTTLGVRHPAHLDYRPEVPRGAMPENVALIQARQACRTALAAAGRHATAAATAQAIDREIAAVRRRKRAIENHRLPQLRTALREIEFTLEEQERQDTARLRLHHNRTAAPRQHVIGRPVPPSPACRGEGPYDPGTSATGPDHRPLPGRGVRGAR